MVVENIMIVKLDHFQFSSFKKNQLFKKSVPHGSVMVVSWILGSFFWKVFGFPPLKKRLPERGEVGGPRNGGNLGRL